MNEHSAGGVVYRNDSSGTMVLLIRDRFGRWTLPKGRLEEGETSEMAALREIEEETGIRGVIEEPLGSTSYSYAGFQGEPVNKTVDYFLVRALNSAIVPAVGEIDRAAWVARDRVAALEGYANNRDVVSKALEILTRVEGIRR